MESVNVASPRPVIVGVVAEAITAELHERSVFAVYEPLDPGGEPLSHAAAARLLEGGTSVPRRGSAAAPVGFVGQYDGGHKAARSIAGGVRTATRVVRSEASVHIVREADVLSLRLR